MTDTPKRTPLTLRRLATYRLERDLTFQQLADEMAAAGYAMRPRSLHLTLTNRTKPRDRTLYKMAQFLASRDVVGVSLTPRRRQREGAEA